jgi:YD repeat-containing protein
MKSEKIYILVLAGILTALWLSAGLSLAVCIRDHCENPVVVNSSEISIEPLLGSHSSKIPDEFFIGFDESGHEHNFILNGVRYTTNTAGISKITCLSIGCKPFAPNCFLPSDILCKQELNSMQNHNLSSNEAPYLGTLEKYTEEIPYVSNKDVPYSFTPNSRIDLKTKAYATIIGYRPYIPSCTGKCDSLGGCTTSPFCKKTVIGLYETGGGEIPACSDCTSAASVSCKCPASCSLANQVIKPQGKCGGNGFSSITRYEYGAFGDIKSITDSEGRITSVVLDQRGRKVSKTHPDAGTTLSSYYDNDNKMSDTTANGDVITYEYDSFNRLTKTIYPRSKDTIMFYDKYSSGLNYSYSRGQLCEVFDSSGATQYYYANDGKTAEVVKAVRGKNLILNPGFEMLGFSPYAGLMKWVSDNWGSEVMFSSKNYSLDINLKRIRSVGTGDNYFDFSYATNINTKQNPYMEVEYVVIKQTGGAYLAFNPLRGGTDNIVDVQMPSNSGKHIFLVNLDELRTIQKEPPSIPPQKSNSDEITQMAFFVTATNPGDELNVKINKIKIGSPWLWTSYSVINLSTDLRSAHSGSKSVNLSYPGISDNIKQTIIIEPGKEYAISLYAKSRCSASVLRTSLNFITEYENFGYASYIDVSPESISIPGKTVWNKNLYGSPPYVGPAPVYYTSINPGTSYSKHEFFFMAPANAVAVIISFGNNNGQEPSPCDGDGILIDDVQMEMDSGTTDFSDDTFSTVYGYTISDDIKYIKYPSGREMSFYLNELGQVDTASFGKNRILGFEYTLTNTFKKINFQNGISVNYNYNYRDWIDNIASTGSDIHPLDEYYDYYDNGNLKRISTEQSFSGQTATFNYDEKNRLVSVDDNVFYGNSVQSQFIKYVYDRTGNRLSKVEGGASSIPYEYYPGTSRLKNDGTYNYEYDNAGNIVKKTEVSSGNSINYFYDENDRLIKAVIPDGKEAYYVYDYMGNLLKSQFCGLTTVYSYDQGSQLLEKFEYGLDTCITTTPSGILTVTPPYFMVQVGTETKAIVGSNGNMTITGSLHTGGISSDCGENDFIVQDRSGQIVACIEDRTGDMWLKAPGNPICNTPDQSFLNAARTKSGNFIVEDSNGDVIMYIDSTGMLFLKGVLGNQERILCS